MTKNHIVLALISLFFGIFFCPSNTQAALLIQAKATGGANLAQNTYDFTDGTGGDFVAEATHISPDSPYRDQGYAKASLTGAGVELKSKSYAPDVYANSFARIQDYFELDTMSGTSGATLDAVLNFNLTGTITLSDIDGSNGTVWAELMARQGSSTGTLLDYKVIRYDALWDSSSGMYVGSNDITWSYLFPVSPTQTGPSFNFVVPLSLDLDQMLADDSIYLSLYISTVGELATVDFSNTLKTNQDNPFVIVSSPPGSSFTLATNSVYTTYGIGLFGELDGQEVSGPVPIPGAIWLLGSGFIGILGVRRKCKK